MSLILEEKYKDKCHLLIWKDEESIDFFRTKVKLSDVEKKLLSSYKVERRQKDLLISRYLIQSILPEAEVNYHPTGKPYLSCVDYQVSISHSKDLVAVILHPSKTVGIDIEYISPRVDKLKERFLSENEIPQANTTEQCTLFWSAKECLFKMDTRQGLDFKEDLNILIKDNKTLLGSIRSKETHLIHYFKTNNCIVCHAMK